jgi:hypothetical protein
MDVCSEESCNNTDFPDCGALLQDPLEGLTKLDVTDEDLSHSKERLNA